MTARLGKALRDLDPGHTDLFQGLQARKSVLLGAADLTPYKWMVFGTHGYLGGDLSDFHDPVLVFSLVGQPKADDG